MKRWQYLLFSTALAVIVLSVGTGSYLAIVRQERLEALERAEREAEIYLEQLREARDQLREAEEHLEALEDMLLNLHQMQQIAERSAAPSRGGRITLATMPVTTPSGFSAARFERAFEDTPLAGIGETLVQAEAETDINALVLAAIIVHESGWGSSRLAQDKNNLAGLGAFDGSEYSSGITFDSRAASVMFLADLLATKYCPGGCYYGGSHDLQGIGVRYASDPAWAQKVAGCMRVIVGRVTS